MNRVRIPELDTPFLFGSRPESLPGDLRPMWRIAAVLLILGIASRGKKSSFGRLHVLNWAIRTEETRAALKSLIRGGATPETVVVRIEPSLNRAVDLASAEGFLQRVSGDRVQLTGLGSKRVEALLKSRALEVERLFLKEIGTSLTEARVKSIFSGNI